MNQLLSSPVVSLNAKTAALQGTKYLNCL